MFAVYAALAMLAIVLLILGRGIAALVIAWLPVILLIRSNEVIWIILLFA